MKPNPAEPEPRNEPRMTRITRMRQKQVATDETQIFTDFEQCPLFLRGISEIRDFLLLKFARTAMNISVCKTDQPEHSSLIRVRSVFRPWLR
jgi:hypothetical protein